MPSIFDMQNIFIVDKEITCKDELFKLIARKASELGYVLSEEECFKGIKERENQQTTGFQDGFAIPHCKNNTVIEPKLLVFKSPPIPWDSLDGLPITFSFALLIPENSTQEHLKYLSRIAKSLIDDEYRQQLKNANKKEIYQIVSRKMEV